MVKKNSIHDVKIPEEAIAARIYAGELDPEKLTVPQLISAEAEIVAAVEIARSEPIHADAVENTMFQLDSMLEIVRHYLRKKSN